MLWHYGRRGHGVVDKYESVPGVINADIVEMKTELRYDLIVTISTLEHVGLVRSSAMPASRGEMSSRWPACSLRGAGSW